MKRLLLILFFLHSFGVSILFSQDYSDAEIYLITCSPGNATYSIYGHSALRIVIPGNNSDLVYNWGIFDFSTPHFAWRFARGHLDYMLGVTSIEHFIAEYKFEERSVYQQKINMTPDDKVRLFSLLAENLKPENVTYRYDFFYDNCSTRIRDLLEKSIGEKLRYPPDIRRELPTFRAKIGYYQNRMPWLDMGIDILLGIRADKKATFRDRMFLPIDLQNNMSEALVLENMKMTPLLRNPEALIQFREVNDNSIMILSPVFIFAFILIIIIVITATVKHERFNNLLDLFVFSVFSIFSIMMIFFNFFTDHQQLRWNLNLIWLSPFVIFCLIDIILGKRTYAWFRIVVILTIISFFIQIAYAQGFNNAFVPLVLILMIRSSVRAGFSWNPLSLTEEDNQ